MPRQYRLVRDDDSDIDRDLDITHHSSVSISRDGRRKNVTAGSPLKRATVERTPAEWSSSSSDSEVQTSRKRYLSSDAPMLEWSGGLESAGYRDQYLDEMIRLDGRGGSLEVTECESCVIAGEAEVGQPSFRCVDCLCDRLECRQCIVRAHARNPLHIIERWTGEFFVRVPLRELGLRIQLGHAGRECVARRAGPVDFTVIHTNGIHKVALDFCDCSQRVQHRQQLLRFRWFPATVQQPQTCATFALLNSFQALKHAGKLSAWEHYMSLVNVTDNTGVDPPKSRYQPYLRIVRQWSHLRMMKRAGRGHSEGGVIATKAGELALFCLACPLPTINLPPDWRERVAAEQFVYRPIMAVDASYRMKNVFASTEKADPGLHTGLAYFVEPRAYKKHLRKHVTQTDISTCSGFQTLAHAETKDSTGLRSTGVVMCLCARHEAVSTLGVGDLQKGERYCNVDYVSLSGCTTFHALDEIFFSYDIACQWRIKLAARMAKLKKHLRVPERIALYYGVPKCHCPGHQLECQCLYSMNLQPGVAMTDGEGIERTWARINACASCTKVMGPGHRHDTIDDLLGGHNWRKRCALGIMLARKGKEAAAQHALQSKAHAELTQALPNANLVKKWTAEVEEWERDRSKPNPYFTAFKHVSEAEVKLSVMKEEIRESVKGVTQLHDTSAGGCLNLAFMIEEAQRRVRLHLKNQSTGDTTTSKALDLTNKRRRILKQIKQFRTVQAAYMPCVPRLRGGQRQKNVAAEDIKLWLPSQLDRRTRLSGCLAGITEKEQRFRESQCADALAEIRISLRTSNALQLNRVSKPTGQKYATRAQSTLGRQKQRCEMAASKYRAAREALLKLDPDGSWSLRFLELSSADLTHFGSTFDIDDEHSKAEKAARKRKKKGKKMAKRHEVLVRPGDGRKVTSWIWRAEGALGDGEDAEMNEAARLEWFKSRARMLRWKEEVIMVEEEKRRTLAGLEHIANTWESAASARVGVDPALGDGLRAYAKKQVTFVCRRMAAHFSELWSGMKEIPEDEEEEDVLFASARADVEGQNKSPAESAGGE